MKTPRITVRTLTIALVVFGLLLNVAYYFWQAAANVD
jgi:hypothetical protein